jgi:2-polyprenyl-3-methyl-5-hydroxy-6-metoxy-1,4-benzoquinol methylase
MRKNWLQVQEEDYRDFKSLTSGSDNLYTFIDDFSEMVDKDKRILEIGCGNGYFLEYLRAYGYTNVVGIDIITQAIADSGNRCNYLLYRMDGHQMAFDSEYFDVVVLAHVMEHSPLPHVMIREISRVLKKGGLIFIEVPIEKQLDDTSAHFSHWVTKEDFIKFISTEFDIIKTNMFRWLMVIGVKK